MLGVRLFQGGTNNYYYYHYDAQGNVSAVTNSSGTVYRQYVYYPYGNVISIKDGSGTAVDINNDSGFNNAYTYRGYRFDSETGLYFLNSRYYAAGIGRFLTRDSVLGHLRSPQTLNRYAYCGGDPVNHVDPDGRDWMDWVLGGIAAIVVVVALLPEEISVAVGTAIMTAASTVATAVSKLFSSPATVEKVIERASPVEDKIANIEQGLNFSSKAAKHMANPARQVPVQILQQAIKSTPVMADPRGSSAAMYYATMLRTGQMYNLEVLYHEATNMVYHFEYSREAMGLLPKILK